MIKKETHKGRTIFFNSEDHTYIDDTGQKYTSVTTLIKRLFPLFPEKEMAKKKARDLNLSEEEILQRWDMKRKSQSFLGTRVHKYAEDIISGKRIQSPFCSKEAKTRKQVDIIWNKIKNKYENFEVEKILFSPKLKIAGQIDLLGISSEIGLIGDWKVTKDIREENPFSKGFGDFSDLTESELNKYSLQLCLYEILIEQEDYFPDIKIFRKELFNVLPERYQIIRVKDLKEKLNKFLIRK